MSTAVASFVAIALLSAMVQPFAPGADGAIYLDAARAIAAGNDPLSAPGYLYPPLLALVLVPFTLLPANLALPLWLVLVAGSTLLLVALLRPLVGLPLAAVAVLAFAPTMVSLYAGNISATIAVLYALALRAASRDDTGQTAHWLVLGTLLKLTPAVGVLVLLIQVRWRALLLPGLLVTVLVLLALPWLAVSAWWAGALRAATIPADAFWSFYSTSWVGVIEFQTPYRAAATPLALALAAITLWRSRSLPLVWALAAASLLPFLVARITWPNHAVMALPALALLWQTSQRGRYLALVSWVGITLPGITPLAMPMLLTLCWATCSWPGLLTAAATPGTLTTKQDTQR